MKTFDTMEAALAAVTGPKDKPYKVQLGDKVVYCVASNQVKAGNAGLLAMGGTVTKGTGPANHVVGTVWNHPCRNGFGRRIAVDQPDRSVSFGEGSARRRGGA